MRSQGDPVDYLRAVALKKPRLQALINQINELTDQDIKNLGEPLWIRDALTRLKASDGTTQKQRLEAMIQRVIEAEEAAAKLPPRTFEVRLWTAGTEFVGRDRMLNRQGWQIEINTNDTFALLDDQIRVGDSTLDLDLHGYDNLVRKSRLIGYMTLDQYRGFHKALLNQRHGAL